MHVRRISGFCILIIGIVFLIPVIFSGATLNVIGGILIPTMIVSGTILILK
jgi:hypothetical protein